jgi:anti-anti-sigma factor
MDIQVSNASTEKSHIPVTIMHIDGNLDSTTYNEFQEKADELIKKGTRYLLVDFTHAPYVSSAGLRALHQIFKELNAIHPDAAPSNQDIKKGIGDGTYKSPYLKLTNLSNESKMVLTSTGFDMFIEFYDDMKKAIASF